MSNTALNAVPGERLSRRNLWSFSAGGIGRDMAYSLTNVWLLTGIMLTKNIGQSEFMWIGIIMILCRIFDGCNDPLMGALIEKTRTKIGKFKPWILAGALTNSVITFLLFWTPLEGTNYVIFFVFGYLLWGITYTMNDISYWGMMPSLTSNENDRNNISTLANLFSGAGAGLIGIAVPFFTAGAFTIGGSALKAYPIIAAIVACVFVGCQIMTVCLVKEKPLPPVDASAPKQSLGKMFKILFNNKQVLWTALTMLVYNIGASLITAGLVSMFVYTRFGYEGASVSLFTTLFGICSAIIIIYPILSKKFTRKQLSKICLVTVIAGYALMLIVALAWKHPSSFYVIAIVGALAAMGQAVFYMELTIGMANCVEYNEWKTGTRDEGMIFSIRPFMAKLGSALQMGIVTIIFSVLGIPGITNEINYFESEAAKNIAAGMAKDAATDIKLTRIQELLSGVDPSVSTWLTILMTIIPTLLFIIAFVIFISKCDITEVKYQAIIRDIALRKKTGEMFAYTQADGKLSNIKPENCNPEYSAENYVFDETEVEKEELGLANTTLVEPNASALVASDIDDEPDTASNIDYNSTVADIETDIEE